MDWHAHIEEHEPPAHECVARVKGTSVEVGAVLALIADGWSIDRIVARFAGLTDEDVRACAAYAKEMMEREALERFVQLGIDSPGRIPHEEIWRRQEAKWGPFGHQTDDEPDET